MKYQEEEFTEKIQRFLSGEMKETERLEFEELIENDDALRDEVEFQRGLTAFMKDEGASKIEERVRDLRMKQENQTSFPWKKAVAAILVLGALAIPAYFFLSNRTPNSVVLANNYFELPPDMITQMGGSTDSLELALSSYNKKDYETAANIFNALSVDSTGYVKFYLSICQIENDQPSEAISTLQTHISKLSNENKLKPMFKWYLILALLKDEKTDQAKNELRAYLKKGYLFNLDKANQLADELNIQR